MYCFLTTTQAEFDVVLVSMMISFCCQILLQVQHERWWYQKKSNCNTLVLILKNLCERKLSPGKEFQKKRKRDWPLSPKLESALLLFSRGNALTKSSYQWNKNSNIKYLINDGFNRLLLIRFGSDKLLFAIKRLSSILEKLLLNLSENFVKVSKRMRDKTKSQTEYSNTCKEQKAK